MTIVKWLVSTWATAPERKEYDRETECFYIYSHGRMKTARRDAKSSTYYRYFDSEAEALEFIRQRAESKANQKSVDQINRCGVELLAALESTISDLFYQIESKHGAEAANKYPSVVEGRAAISKAKGLA